MAYGVSTRAAEGTAAGLEIAGHIAGTTAVATKVSGLLAAAGVSAGTAPVVGWIVAAGLTVAAGVITLVKMFKQRRLREGQAIQIAQQLGIPGAASVPGWIFDALSMGYNQRRVEAERLQRKLGRGGTLGNPIWKIRTKLTILGVLEALEIAEQRAAAGLTPIPPSPQLIADIRARAERINKNARLMQAAQYGVVLGGLGIFALLLFSED